VPGQNRILAFDSHSVSPKSGQGLSFFFDGSTAKCGKRDSNRIGFRKQTVDLGRSYGVASEQTENLGVEIPE
jgi:hypothetical protein